MQKLFLGLKTKYDSLRQFENFTNFLVNVLNIAILISRSLVSYLSAFFAHDSDADVGLLYHADVIGPVPNGQSDRPVYRVAHHSHNLIIHRH